MVNFLQLIKAAPRPRIDLKLVLLLVVFLLAILFWQELPTRPIRALSSFLPENTIFYLHSFDFNKNSENWLSRQGLINQRDIDEHWRQIQNLLKDDFSDVQEIIWFKTAASPTSDAYLIKTTAFASPLAKRLQNQTTDYYFVAPDRHALFIGSAPDLIRDLSNQKSNRFAGADFGPGLNFYWQFGQYGNVQLPFAGWLEPLLSKGDTWLSSYQRGQRQLVKIYQSSSAARQPADSFKSYANLKIPESFDLAIAYQGLSDDLLKKFIRDNLLNPVFKNLPGRGLSYQKQAAYFDSSQAMFQKDNDWLLVGSQDWSGQVADLSSQVDLVEKKSQLPDHTSYIELIAKDPQPKEREYLGKRYWQFGDLYSWPEQGDYYLSNSRGWLEQTMTRQDTVADRWSDCLGSQAPSITDFVILPAAKLPVSQTRSYLQLKNMGLVSIFGYNDEKYNGWIFCF